MAISDLYTPAVINNLRTLMGGSKPARLQSSAGKGGSSRNHTAAQPAASGGGEVLACCDSVFLDLVRHLNEVDLMAGPY